MGRDDLDAARQAIRASVDAARARNADYELAMSLDVVARTPELLDLLEPERAEALLTGRDTLFERFGVVRR